MALKPGYKQTEVGVIPEDWEVKTIGELGSFTKGQGIQKSEVESSGIPCIRYGEIYTHHNEIIRSFYSYISLSITKTSKKLKKGDILFAGSGETKKEIGKCVAFVSEEEVYVGGDIVILRPTYGVSEFLGYLLNAPFVANQKASKGQGDAVVHISSRALASILIPLPPPREQQAIAEVLSDVDELLAGLDQLIAKKRDLKQATMQQLLTGRVRLPGFSGAWQVRRLGDLARIQRGASPRPIDNPIWFDENSSIGWVRISDVTKSGIFLRETVQKLSPLGVQNSRFVEPESLIMSICATVGRPVITEFSVCIHDGFVVFDNLEANKFFLYYLLKWIEPDWSKHGQTGSQMNLNTALINGTQIKLPPLTEQIAIAEFLADMDNELVTLEQQRAKTHALKQALLQELLTGKTRLI